MYNHDCGKCSEGEVWRIGRMLSTRVLPKPETFQLRPREKKETS